MRRFCRRRSVATLAIGVLLLALFHGALLRGLAYPLVACDDLGPADYLLFMPDARLSKPAFKLAAGFVRTDPTRHVLLYSGYVNRAAAIRAEPPFAEFVGLELQEHGVPEAAIEVIRRPDSVTYTRMFHDMVTWLDSREPDDTILLVTHRLKAGSMRFLARQALTPSQRSRIRIVGLPAMGIDESNWWHSSAGVKWVAACYLSLAHLRLFGEFQPNYDWDPDAYEHTLETQVSPAIAD